MLTTLELAALMRGLAPVMRDAVAGATRELSARVADLEARLAAPAVPGPAGPAGPRGADGKDGADGLGLEDFDVVQGATPREFTLRWARGARQVERTFSLPVVLDCGVYTPGTTYAAGDSVSYQGTVWVAQEATGAQPGTTRAWRLAVKKGRDGRNGRDGAPGPEGPPGRPGLDLTQVDGEGRKWR